MLIKLSFEPRTQSLQFPLLDCHKLDMVKVSLLVKRSFPSVDNPTESELIKATFFTCTFITKISATRANLSTHAMLTVVLTRLSPRALNPIKHFCSVFKYYIYIYISICICIYIYTLFLLIFASTKYRETSGAIFRDFGRKKRTEA